MHFRLTSTGGEEKGHLCAVSEAGLFEKHWEISQVTEESHEGAEPVSERPALCIQWWNPERV